MHDHNVIDKEVAKVNAYDGVEVYVDLNQSGFGSESDYEYESEEMADSNDSNCDALESVQKGQNKTAPPIDEVRPGGSKIGVNEYQTVLQDQGFRAYFNQMMDDKLENSKKEWKDEQLELMRKGKSPAACRTDVEATRSNVNHDNTCIQIMDSRAKGNSPLVKSPSDTTIYAPALKRMNVRECDPTEINNINQHDYDCIVNKISNIAETVRNGAVERDDNDITCDGEMPSPVQHRSAQNAESDSAQKKG